MSKRSDGLKRARRVLGRGEGQILGLLADVCLLVEAGTIAMRAGTRIEDQTLPNEAFRRQRKALDPETIAAMILLAKDPDNNVRAQLINLLSAADPGCAMVFPTLVSALKDPNRDIREVAANALGNLGAKAEPAIPALLAALNRPDAGSSRTAIVEALTDIGPAALSARPALIAW